VLFNHERHIKKDVVCKAEKKANLDCWLACHN
jgi:hypothetical protein